MLSVLTSNDAVYYNPVTYMDPIRIQIYHNRVWVTSFVMTWQSNTRYHLLSVMYYCGCCVAVAFVVAVGVA